MEILLSVLGVFASVLIYDFYASRKWQMVTSAIRNDLVFANRNKSYGAYALRRDYDRNMMYIMLGVILGFGVLFGTYYLVRSSTAIEIVPEFVDVDGPVFDPSANYKTPTEIEKEKQKKDEPEKTEANLEPQPTDKTVTEPVKVPDPGTKAGAVTQTGSGSTGTVLPPTNPLPPVKVDTVEVIPPIIDIPDVDPKYKGNLPKDIVDELNYPQIAIEGEKQGKCYIKFVVNIDGTVSNVTVVRGVPDCPECDREAIRVIKKLNKWEPAVDKGKKVRSTISLPINFVLQ